MMVITGIYLVADNGNTAYSNGAFQSDSEHKCEDHNQQKSQPSVFLKDDVTGKPVVKPKYDDFGSTTYLNQVCLL